MKSVYKFIVKWNTVDVLSKLLVNGMCPQISQEMYRCVPLLSELHILLARPDLCIIIRANIHIVTTLPIMLHIIRLEHILCIIPVV